MNQITSQLKARNDSLHSIRLATQADDNLVILKYIIQQGWPKTIKEVHQEIQKYWKFHEELMIEDGLILKGTRIVIPDKKREEILKQIHEGHLGLNKCQMHAKETVYWPGLNDQLEQLILNCQLCQKYSKSKNKSTPHTALGHEVPPVPWSKVATQHITEHFKSIFSEYGWPDTVVRDNGPCYAAEMFTNLMKEYAVNHITSSPLMEKYVQIMKNLFYKAKEEGADIDKYLMIYHNTLRPTHRSPRCRCCNRHRPDHSYPCPYVARRRLGIVAEQEQQPHQNQHLPLHDFHIGQDVMCQSPIT